MRLSKRISVTIFISILLFILCISSTAIKDQHMYGSDKFGWPQVFYMVNYNDGRIESKDLDLIKLFGDYFIWLGSTAMVMTMIRLMKIDRKKV
ncbi:hypothetical protein GALL_173110 [mine drainage metagenome]|uniref:DUF4306 domain-containing protein n=1 Tax=mine drainage metagenome TaxID=410659 RepID=A0A1J5SG06_9ZZZZ